MSQSCQLDSAAIVSDKVIGAALSGRTTVPWADVHAAGQRRRRQRIDACATSVVSARCAEFAALQRIEAVRSRGWDQRGRRRHSRGPQPDRTITPAIDDPATRLTQPCHLPQPSVTSRTRNDTLDTASIPSQRTTGTFNNGAPGDGRSL